MVDVEAGNKVGVVTVQFGDALSLHATMEATSCVLFVSYSVYNSLKRKTCNKNPLKANHSHSSHSSLLMKDDLESTLLLHSAVDKHINKSYLSKEYNYKTLVDCIRFMPQASKRNLALHLKLNTPILN